MSGPLAARVVAIIEDLGFPYALVGAAALAARGVVRGTHDFDLMATDASLLDLPWTERLPAAVEVEVLRGDVDDPLRGTVRLTEGGEAVDVVIGKWKWQAAVIARSEPISLGGFTVPVPRVEDLILLKLDAGSYLDERDAGALVEVHGRGVLDDARRRLAEVPDRLRERFDRFAAELEERGVGI